MRQEIASLMKAWQMWQSDSQRDSVLAVVLVAVVVAPFVIRAWQSSGRDVQLSAGQRTNS